MPEDTNVLKFHMMIYHGTECAVQHFNYMLGASADGSGTGEATAGLGGAGGG